MATALQNQAREGWIRVFCPHTRYLSSKEVEGISLEERMSTEAGDEGVWLEVRCPDDKCLTGEHKMTIEVRGVEGKKEGLWHKLFCPEDRCFAQSPADLP
jgi:hypothetical protein